MSENPSLWGRMVSRLQGEVPADTLQAYRRASLPVFELLEQVEARRLACATEGLNPWTVPPATRAEFLCAWNAFVLQSLGNDLLDADYREDPPTAGYVPPVTADQVMAFYTQVQDWLNRAHQAHANPAYRLDVAVPATLPPWSQVQPCVPSHVRGLLQAMSAVRDHAAAAMTFLPETAPRNGHQLQLQHIRQVHASAQSKARYALDLYGANASPEVLEPVRQHARHAIELYYQLGQLIADPWLAGRPAAPPAPPPKAAPSPAKALALQASPASAPAKAPAPPAGAAPSRAVGGKRRESGKPVSGDPEFDIWCLTDPEARAVLEQDAEARRVLQALWRQDPHPARAVAIHTEIQEAMDRGDVALARKGPQRLGYYYRCPWGPVYVAIRDVTIATTRLLPRQQFVLGAGTPEPGEPFRCGIVAGSFTTAEGVEYGPA